VHDRRRLQELGVARRHAWGAAARACVCVCV
jgi:hypothetical protein